MAGDDSRFEALYEAHHRAVSNYCDRRMAAADAPDAVAEVFAIAWRRFDDIPDPALPWLYGVARKVVSHHWRGASRSRRLAEKAKAVRALPASSPESEAVAGVEHQLVREAVMQLRPIDREVLLLSAWEGLTHGEIATVLECSVAAIDKRMTRAKARLARRYEAIAGAAQDGGGREISRCAPNEEVTTREP